MATEPTTGRCPSGSGEADSPLLLREIGTVPGREELRRELFRLIVKNEAQRRDQRKAADK